MSYQSVNPFDGKVLATFHSLTNSELEMAMDSAHNCYEDWKRRSFENKAKVLLKAAAPNYTIN
jgi:succinate-semialdehyde dehydrogenase / glutarate-semialdehyde dehydrogenase